MFLSNWETKLNPSNEPSKGVIACEYFKLLKEVFGLRKNTLKPYEFYRAFGNVYPSFKNKT